MLSVCIITFNEEANLGRALESVRSLVGDGRGEIIVVDSGSTDRTVEIARSYGAKVFIEPWKGFAAQKNSAIAKAQGQWILSLDADEELSAELAERIKQGLAAAVSIEQVGRRFTAAGYFIPRRNYFLGRWMRFGGFYPDAKLRLFQRGLARFPERNVHEAAQIIPGARLDFAKTETLNAALLHHSYPTLTDYIEHMNRYSSLGAEMLIGEPAAPAVAPGPAARAQQPATERSEGEGVAEPSNKRPGPRAFNPVNIILRPLATFIYNYCFRLGFLDGKEGLLLHLYHSVYASWKYAKAWELGRPKPDTDSAK